MAGYRLCYNPPADRVLLKRIEAVSPLQAVAQAPDDEAMALDEIDAIAVHDLTNKFLQANHHRRHTTNLPQLQIFKNDRATWN